MIPNLNVRCIWLSVTITMSSIIRVDSNCKQKIGENFFTSQLVNLTKSLLHVNNKLHFKSN